MNTIYERLNTFLWSHPTYKKVVGFLTIALKYIMMASYVMLLIGFYMTHDDYLIYAIIKPCAAFLIVTVVRKLINQSRPYDHSLNIVKDVHSLLDMRQVPLLSLLRRFILIYILV